MGKKIVTGYLIFCIFFFVALLSLLTFRIKAVWDKELDNAYRSFNRIENILSSALLSFKYYNSQGFLSRIRSSIEKEARLYLLVIYNSKLGIQYLYSRGHNYLEDTASLNSETQWEGSPAYTRPLLGSKILTRSFTGAGETYIDGLYIIIGKEDLFPIVKESFIILFVFFIATCTVLIIIPAGRSEQEEKTSEESDRSTTPADYLEDYPGRPPPSPDPEKAASIMERGNLFSPDTGLGWSNHLPQRLKFEIDRAASLDQDLVLALLSIHNYRQINNREVVYTKIAKLLLKHFSFQDLIFEYRPGSYALIIPDTDLDLGIQNIEDFRRRVSSIKILDQKITLSVGLSSRNGRLINGATLLAESAKALKKAHDSKKDVLIAFRANPDKYRDFVSKKV